MAGLTKVKGSGLATGAATASLVGIDDNATSTAITIDSSENTHIGNSDDVGTLLGYANAENRMLIKAADPWGTDPGIQLAISRNTNTDGRSHPSLHFTGDHGTGLSDDHLIMTLHSSFYDNESVELGSSTNTCNLTVNGEINSTSAAKAWVNFNGTGTVSIRDSHNVSSIGDNGTGDYTVNFSNNMASANYAGAGLAANDGESLSYRGGIGWTSASYSRIAHKSLSNSYIDGSLITFIVFGD